MPERAPSVPPRHLLRIAALAAMTTAGAACAASPPAAGPGPRVEDARQELRLSPWRLEARVDSVVDSVVESVMAEDRIPGAAVVVVHGGSPVVAKGYGLADVATGRPVTVGGTIFRLGSVSKALTAMAVARLVDEGRVELDAPVSRYVPEVPTAGPGGEPVLVRHLLTHTAGYDQVGARRQVDDPARRPALGAFLERELVPVREPGRLAVYDTYGMTLAGLLVERVSGQSYGEYMRRRIFEPLGMTSTWVEAPPSERDRLAVGYGLEDGEPVPQSYEWYVTLPASSIDGTVADMGRLVAALLGDGGGVLSPGMAARIRTESLHSYGDMETFSWGFWIARRGGYRALDHGGVMRGYSSQLYLVPGADIGFFVAYNRDLETGPPTRLREALIDLLHERVLPEREGPVAAAAAPGPASPAARAPAPVATADLVGTYGRTVACYTCQEGEGWGLSWVRVDPVEPGVIRVAGDRFLAVDSLTFVEEASGERLRFLADPAGRVRWMARGPGSFVRLDTLLLAEVLGPGWRDRPAEPLTAKVYRARGDWEEAAAAYASLGRTTPENGRVAFYEGYSLLNAGRPEAAVPPFRRAMELGRWVPWSQYYVAAARAAAGDTAGAWAALDRALELGFSDARLLESEPWWEGLRETPEYRAALDRTGG